ncbi:MAG: TPM domain-containing protein, partial [Bdellovibrionales bacterium]|nr:TPM domain-containing protein [Bdellovibrionales bacterium]
SFDCICRWLTSEQDLMIQVQQRAVREFYEHQIHNTEASTGILIFLSIMEQKAVILGDKSISERLTPETWQNIIDTLLSGVKKRQTLTGLKKAIELSGQLLTTHFPIQPNDKNELKNHLIITD